MFPSCRCCAGRFCKYALCRTFQFCSYPQIQFILPQEEKAQQPAWLQSAVCEKATKRFHDLQERTEASCGGGNQHHRLCRREQNPGPEGEQSLSHKTDQEMLNILDGWQMTRNHFHIVGTQAACDTGLTVCLLCLQWKMMTRKEQAKYYEEAKRERAIHAQLYPDWSAKDNYVRTQVTPLFISESCLNKILKEVF